MISRCSRPEKAAAEAEAERGGGFHLVGEARVVEPEPAHGRAQRLEIGGVDREQAAEHHRDRRAEARQRRRHRLLLVGDGVADAGVGHLLDRGGEKADLAGAELVALDALGREDADAVDLVGRVGLHHQDALALFHHAVDDAEQHDDAEIGVVPAVDEERLERRRGVALGRRQAGDDRFQDFRHVQSGLGRDQNRVRGIKPDHVLDLLLDLVGLGGRQIDLVEHRNDLEIVVERLIDVGERLRLDALAGVDDEQRALAGGERTVDLIGEVDVAGRVDEVEDVILAVVRAIFEANGLRLDRDAALALDIHGIEHLLDHFARFEPAGELNQPVGKGRFAVVDMGDDREIADIGDGSFGHAAQITPACQSGKPASSAPAKAGRGTAEARKASVGGGRGL